MRVDPKSEKNSVNLSNQEIIKDYRIAFQSRHASIIGRREVLSGKAKFGIFGDGKEVAQVAMARAFRKGDWRSGYYRDQTFMFAIGGSDLQKFFAQLYADSDLKHEPSSGGRQMNSHFSTRYLDENGQWLNQCMMYNSSADMSPTAGQMSRLLGLGYASKLYREIEGLSDYSQFSVKGNEVAFGTIGDASTSEGIFWESINAMGVLQIPVCMSVWDDGYGISVPKRYQTTHESISEACAGFKVRSPDDKSGMIIVRVPGYDYPSLLKTYHDVVDYCRKHHKPALIHVYDLTQPQGHSTSGSHERYKDIDRMQFEKDMDCLSHMRQWMIDSNIATEKELDELEKSSLEEVQNARELAWENLMSPIQAERDNLIAILEKLAPESAQQASIQKLTNDLKRTSTIFRRIIASTARRALISVKDEAMEAKSELKAFVKDFQAANHERYSKYFYAEGNRSALRVEPVAPIYSPKGENIDGRNVINRCFDYHLGRDPRLFIIGEDVGHIGGVNAEFEGLQEKHGFWRVTDTGIREATILGQGIGAAMRGLRPIVDIQYLDYVLYCLQGMSDDLATLHYRSGGGQIAPVIVRTKGHRLEGIWHTGSPMGALLHATRGMHFCVPRNMVQAAGMYNTLLEADDPAFVCEVLNGYRLKEAVPENLNEFKLALGTPEVLREGSDITIVTYGACVRVAEDAARLLSTAGIDVELIDVQTLMPFDVSGVILKSLKKTNAILFFDEDVSGGATAYMMQQVLDRDGGYDFLDSQPKCLSAKDHRSAYGSDGDYYCKPNAEDVFDVVYGIVHERDPYRFPQL